MEVESSHCIRPSETIPPGINPFSGGEGFIVDPFRHPDFVTFHMNLPRKGPE